jgi:hypothetical protein
MEDRILEVQRLATLLARPLFPRTECPEVLRGLRANRIVEKHHDSPRHSPNLDVKINTYAPFGRHDSALHTGGMSWRHPIQIQIQTDWGLGSYSSMYCHSLLEPLDSRRSLSGSTTRLPRTPQPNNIAVIMGPSSSGRSVEPWGLCIPATVYHASLGHGSTHYTAPKGSHAPCIALIQPRRVWSLSGGCWRRLRRLVRAQFLHMW